MYSLTVFACNLFFLNGLLLDYCLHIILHDLPDIQRDIE